MSNPTPLSLGEYAEHRAARGLPGQSKNAVSKAIKRGCLVRSVVRNHRGEPKIADPSLADREWAAGTDHSKAPASVKALAAPRPRPPPAPAAPSPQGDDDVTEPTDLNLALESAREKFWKAHLAELEFKKRSGELVDAVEMKAEIDDAFTRVRARLLGVPTRARQQLPELTPQHIATIDSLIREALDELVVGLEQDGEEEEAVA